MIIKIDVSHKIILNDTPYATIYFIYESAQKMESGVFNLFYTSFINYIFKFVNRIQ